MIYLSSDVVSWNSMIAGYAMHGFATNALKLFKKMQLYGVNPIHTTLVFFLSKCCHGDLVEDASHYFYCMNEQHLTTFATEHYGFMVHVLDRVGLLKEAQDFTNRIPIEPDTTMGACLLGVCRIQNNVELA